MSDPADTPPVSDGHAEPREARIGLISDTHGALDPRVLQVFREAEVTRILHAGDVGMPALLWELGSLANVTAVSGNCDYSELQFELASRVHIEINGRRILIIHDLDELGAMPGDVDLIVRGHTHVPGVITRGAVTVINPGSASQCRKMPSCSVAVLTIAADGDSRVEIMLLDDVETLVE